MLSIGFILGILPCVIIIYWSLQHYRPQWAPYFLILFSILFLAFQDLHSALILLSLSLLNYFVALLRPRFGAQQQWFVALTVLASLAPLAFFKLRLLGFENPLGEYRTFLGTSDFLIPLGISFYTFHLISFQLDNLRAPLINLRARDFALYCTFFPQVINGPIVRIRRMWSQLKSTQRSSKFVYVGIALFTIGLSKKVIVADLIGSTFQAYLGGYHRDILFHWDVATTMIVGMTTQLYFDFSAYSDMAVGLGYMFGYSLPVNFNSPFRKGSPIETWRQWNKTLTQFIRVYVYENLPWSWHAKIIFCMMLFGLWHGPFAGFILFGLFHGLLLVFNHWLRAALPNGKNRFAFKAFEKILMLATLLLTAPLIRVGEYGFYEHILRSFFMNSTHQFRDISSLSFFFICTAFAMTLVMPNSLEWIHLRGRLRVIEKGGPVLVALLLFACLFFVGQTKNFIYYFF